jgi:hypothetical protein
MKRTKIELKPCPECGAFGPELGFRMNPERTQCMVWCGNGHSFGPGFDTEGKAAIFWNRLKRECDTTSEVPAVVDPDFDEVQPSADCQTYLEGPGVVVHKSVAEALSPHEETGYVADMKRAGDVAEAALEQLCDTPLPRLSEDSGEYTRWLGCQLTDAEMLDRSKTMTERMNELADVKAEKAKVVREYAENIKKLEGEISRLSEAVRSGKEMRTVRCMTRKDFSNLKATVFRLDTHEVIETRKIDKSETQAELF